MHSEGTFPEMFGIQNHTLDTMVHEAAEEMNGTVRGQMYHDISMALQENCYYISAMQETSFHVERVDVSGYYHNPMHAGLYFSDLSFEEQDNAERGPHLCHTGDIGADRCGHSGLGAAEPEIEAMRGQWGQPWPSSC